MKKLILALAILATCTVAKAQEPVTEEQVWKYALMTAVIDEMKADISASINDLIKKQEGMTGQRYLELSKGAEPANEFESKFLENVNKLKDDRVAAIKSVNSDLATKMLGGAAVYKAVKAAVKADMKEKYEAYKTQIAYSESM
ncbi:MAG: hypothetical protein AAGA85_09780 [Bacteroidota bacterium]